MAVSNAFGSNTFNIFIALGFPWMIGTILRPNCDDDPAHPGEVHTTQVLFVPLPCNRVAAV